MGPVKVDGPMIEVHPFQEGSHSHPGVNRVLAMKGVVFPKLASNDSQDEPAVVVDGSLKNLVDRTVAVAEAVALTIAVTAAMAVAMAVTAAVDAE